MGEMSFRCALKVIVSKGCVSSSERNCRVRSFSGYDHLLEYTYDMGRNTIRMWIHQRHGAIGTQSGSSHSSGGTGLTISHSRTPSTLSQNLAQCGPLSAPPSFHSVLRAFCIRGSSASTPSIRSTV